MRLRSRGSVNLEETSNQRLAQIEKENRRKKKTMGAQQPDLAALMAQMEAVIAANEKTTADNARLEARLRQMEAQNEQQIVTVGGTAKPHTFYTERSPIIIPALTVNYEPKASLIHLVEQKPFSGLTTESPIDHIDRFEKVCGNINVVGVPADYNRCKLFEFSLRDKAAKWLSSLPPRSLNGWSEIRAAFLDNYYTKTKTASLKAQLTNFQQFSGENFSDAWARFQSYSRDCPHHSFSDSQLLSIFYDGVDWDAKSALNAASRGNFMTQSVDGAKELIENLAESYRDREADYDRRGVKSVESEKLEELVELMKLSLKKNKGVQFADVDAVHEKTDEEVNFVGNRYNNSKPWYNKPFSGGNQRPFGDSKPYASSSSYSPKSREDEVKAMFEQVLESQEKHAVSFNGKLDKVYVELDGKFNSLNQRVEQIAAHQKKMDVQIAQTAEAVKQQEGFLPGKTSVNPKQNCNAVTTRSGRQLENPPEIARESVEVNWIVSEDMELDDESDPSEPQVSVDRHIPGVDRHSSENLHSVLQISDDEEEASKPASRTSLDTSRDETISSHIGKRVSNDTPTGVDRHTSQKRPRSELSSSSQASTSSGPATSKRLREKAEKKRSTQVLEQVRLEVPLLGQIETSPMFTRFFKMAVSRNCSLEQCIHMVYCGAIAILKNLMLDRLEDPGSVDLNCSIFHSQFDNSLCDLGSGVNIMPLSVAQRLGMTVLQDYKYDLSFADSTVRRPDGIIENVPVQVGKLHILTDFVVLRYAVEPTEPIILGRPFLAAAGAIIDCKESSISLNANGHTLRYRMNRHSRRPMLDGQMQCAKTMPTLVDYQLEDILRSVASPEQAESATDEVCTMKIEEARGSVSLVSSDTITSVARHPPDFQEVPRTIQKVSLEPDEKEAIGRPVPLAAPPAI